MINKNMKIAELLELNVSEEKINKIAETLFSFGMHCLGCGKWRNFGRGCYGSRHRY